MGSDRYGWGGGGGRDRLDRIKENQYNRNWTSIDLAKPVWEEEQEGRGEPDSFSVGSGSVHQLDINEVDTYGFWDQSLDIMPAMSRSTDPRPKQWVLLSKTAEIVDLVDKTDEAQDTN